MNSHPLMSQSSWSAKSEPTMNEAVFAQGTELLLWPDGAPEADGHDPIDVPAITIHLPKPELATGTGIIVNPGGGYRILASDHEGLQVARWLNRNGIAAFVLRYRVGPKYHSEVSLLDGCRAMRMVRSKASEFGISPTRIGMLGFSAGGHLVAAVGTRYDEGCEDSSDPVDRASSRPDFLVPVYAVTNGIKRGRKGDEYTAVDELVTAATPPTFLVHTHEDSIVPSDQAILFYRALAAHGVEAELHVFGYGEHGAGMASGDPDLAEWPLLLMRWLRSSGLLTDTPRTAVKGRATINGTAPGMFWVTLIPVDSNAPIARVKANRSSDGQFEIDSVHGPVPGPHLVEIHHISDIYPHVATGVYSNEDSVCYTLQAEVIAGEFLELKVVG
jgi:acetyl esterase/lipase